MPEKSNNKIIKQRVAHAMRFLTVYVIPCVIYINKTQKEFDLA